MKNNKRPTQCQRVLKYMESHVGITQKQAMDMLGVSRLPSRIYELREQGYNITFVWKKVENRFHETTRIKQYRLIKEG